MREAGLVSKYKKPQKPKSKKAQENAVYADNLLARQFEAETPGHRWLTDIKYIWTSTGWVFLCVVLDLHSRQVVGWAVQEHMRDTLVLEVVSMALQRVTLQEGAMLHSDRGSQFISDSYQELLRTYGITCSMSRKENCWDNAAMESFFGTLQQELLVDTAFENVHDTRAGLFEFIEIYYNRQRIHSSIDYRTPDED